jgi:hypothetical protein
VGVCKPFVLHAFLPESQRWTFQACKQLAKVGRKTFFLNPKVLGSVCYANPRISYERFLRRLRFALTSTCLYAPFPCQGITTRYFEHVMIRRKTVFKYTTNDPCPSSTWFFFGPPLAYPFISQVDILNFSLYEPCLSPVHHLPVRPSLYLSCY